MVRLRRVACVLSVLALIGSALPVLSAKGAPPGTSPSPTPVATVELPPREPAPSVAPSSSVGVPLPRTPRVVSRVPQFAGPATLEVDGGSGLSRWTDLHFGTQEVVLRVNLVPASGEPSCSARVRLGDDKPPLYRHVFAADPSRKSTHRETVAVDYSTVSLVVTTDCGAWSLVFVPRDDPTLPMTITESTYVVTGNTVPALVRALRHIDGEWSAYARIRAEWTWRWIDRGSYCEVVSGTASVMAHLTMPEWKRPQDADARVVSEWERVRANMLIHELGHVTIALQGAAAIDARLDAGLRAKTCERVDRLADKTASAIWKRHQARDDRYDRDTQHGRTQGLWFD